MLQVVKEDTFGKAGKLEIVFRWHECYNEVHVNCKFASICKQVRHKRDNLAL